MRLLNVYGRHVDIIHFWYKWLHEHRDATAGGKIMEAGDRLKLAVEPRKPITTAGDPAPYPLAQIKLQLSKRSVRLHGCSAYSAGNLNPNIFFPWVVNIHL